MDSGMLSQSSPLSILRFAMFLILARLSRVSRTYVTLVPGFTIPVLEPDLHRPFGHVDVLGNTLSHECSRGRILIELHLECHQLILRGPLALLIFLLLGKGAFPRRATRRIRVVRSRDATGRRHPRLVIFRAQRRRLVFQLGRLRLWPRKGRRSHDVGHIDRVAFPCLGSRNREIVALVSRCN